MVAVKNIALFVTGAFAIALPRDAAQALSDLQTIDSDTNALTSAANSYTGGAIGAIPVANAESKVESAIKAATTDANNSAPVTAAQAQSVIDYINNTLEPDIASAVSAIVAKKSQFEAAGLQSTVENDFKNLISETNTYGSALLAKAPSSEQSAGQAALAKVIAQLQSGENAFA